MYRRVLSGGARVLARPLTPLSDPMTGFFGLRKDVLGRFVSLLLLLVVLLFSLFFFFFFFSLFFLFFLPISLACPLPPLLTIHPPLPSLPPLPNRGKNINTVGFKISLELYVKCGVANHAEVPIIFGVRQYGYSKLSSKIILHYLQHLRLFLLFFFAFLLCIFCIFCVFFV